MSGMLRFVLLAAVLVPAPIRAESVMVGDFADLLFWAGDGENQAALVLYFNDPTYGDGGAPPAVAWGYRWNGAATQADMLFALAGSITVTGTPAAPPTPQPGSDPRLAIDVEYFNAFGLTGYLLTSLRYDQVGLPSPWQQIMRTMDNTAEPPPAGFIDIAPYQVVSGTGTAWPAGGIFDLITDTGISNTPLQDRGWYGFVEALYEIDPDAPDPYIGFPAVAAFAQPTAAVPEPAAVALAAAGLAILGVRLWRPRRRGTLCPSAHGSACEWTSR